MTGKRRGAQALLRVEQRLAQGQRPPLVLAFRNRPPQFGSFEHAEIIPPKLPLSSRADMLRAPTMTASPPSDPGVLRLARAGDVDDILTLIAEHSEQLLPRGPTDIDALLETFWVVDTPEGIVGCCCLEVYSSKIAEVRSLAVRASARAVATARASWRRRWPRRSGAAFRRCSS